MPVTRAHNITHIGKINSVIPEAEKQEFAFPKQPEMSEGIEDFGVADGAIADMRAVHRTANNKVKVVNNSLVAQKDIVVGVSLDGAIDGKNVRIAVRKEIYMRGHGFSVGSPIYINGTAGELSNTQPSTGFVKTVGAALDANRLMIDISEAPIKL